MTISIIVAIAKNNAIGKNNDLLWHLPNDMKFFKETTEEHCIITGRKNYFSIPEKYRPLRNRINIVVTRQEDLKLEEGVIVCNTIEEAIEVARSKSEQEEVFIIGGGEIYKQSLKLTDKLYITEVDTLFEDADTFFPIIDNTEWKETSRKHFEKNKKHSFDYDFVVYER